MPYIGGLFPNERVVLSSFINAFPVGALILDTNRRVVLLNRALEGLLGLSSEEAEGLPCYAVLRARACLRCCPSLALDTASESVSVESDIINRERQLVPVRITTSAVKGFEGNLVGFLEVIEDLRAMQGLHKEGPTAFSFGGIVGKSPEMEKIFRILPVLAESDSSILITGETGTGKDVIAEAIHQASNRAKGPFIKVNCGALPETLLESELFGHTKGAFTGAVDDKPGRFRMANNGTLYLTEIGDLPLPLQVKLLTFLDDKTVYPIGSTRGYSVDVRVIAATHRNLEEMVAKGTFRKDLFYRLNVVRLHLPALRERGEDILLLLDHFVRLFSHKLNKTIEGFSPQALRELKKYPYPGNVRELRNIVEYAVNVCDARLIFPRHLPPYLLESEQEQAALMARTPVDTSAGMQSNPLANFASTDNWSDIERKIILDALAKAKGRRNEAARLLGWARSTLWRKMKQYEIN